MATGMIGKKPIIGPIADQQEITGKVNNAIQMAFYKGLETDTAKVIINNTAIERTIKTDVKRTPNSLTITDKTDSLEPANWVVSHFDGSKALAIQLKHYTIKHLPGSNKEFALFKNGIQEGETISIPDGETIDEVILVLDSGVPYLEFTFKNSTREPLFCSLEGLGIAEIISRLNNAETNIEENRQAIVETKEDLADTKEQLETTKELLDTTVEDLAETKENLEATKEDLAETQEDLEAAKEDIEQLKLTKIYKSLDKVKPYLYEIDFDTIDYDYAKEYFRSKQAEVPVTGCSAVRNGNFYGRNFDWTYGEGVDFVVRVPSYNGRYSSVGVSSAVSLAQFTEAFVDSKEPSELYKIVPFYTVDAINEKGLFINTNVVPLDHEPSEPTVPTVSKEDEICSLMLPRYVVDNFATADEAIQYLKEHVSIYMFKKLQDMHYELHCLIGDANKTYTIEFINSQLVATPCNKITNFYINGVTFNGDGKVYTPETQDEEHDAIKTNGVTPRGSGLERYNIIIDNFSTANTKEGMRDLMNKLTYSRAYTNEEDKWYTEFVGDYNGGTMHYTCASPKDYYETNIIPSINDNVMHYTKELYEHRTRSSGDTWQTVHSCVYDIEKRKLYVIAQEDGIEYSFDLPHYYTAAQVDSLIDNEANEREIADTLLDTKITSVEEKVDTIEEEIDKDVVISSSISSSGDVFKIIHDKINIKSGEETSEEDILPLANSTNAGIMSPTTVQGIQQLTEDVAILKAQTIRLLYTEKANPTAEEILAFVQSKGYSDPTKYTGIAVVVQETGHIWKWISDQEVFKDFGVDTVNQFTNQVAGIIKGSENEGQVYAEDNGTGSVVGWDALKAEVAEKANDDEVVHLAGHEIISGTKQFGGYTYFNNNVYINANTTTRSILPHYGGTFNIGAPSSGMYNYVYTYYISDGSYTLSINDIAHKSTVSASSTGTSTYEVNYLTIDGTEYKIGGSSIIDYEYNLPEITADNKDSLARLDGDEVYTAQYLVQPGQDVKILFDFAKNGQTITSAELAEQDYISDISCAVQGYTARLILPDETYCAIRSGSSKNPGTLSFDVDRLPEEGSLYAVFANYFGVNTSTQAVTGATNTSITVTYPDGTTADFDLPFVSATVKPDDYLIELTQLGTYSVAIKSGVTVNRYHFRGIAYSQAASEVKEWKQLARTEYVDEQIETVENEITTLATEVAQNSLDIETLQTETTNLNVRVTTIETEMGTVQVFDADELPEATVDYLDKIYRVDGKLYQVISLGDGFQKEYSFENVTGTNEIANKDSWDGFAQQVTNNFDRDFDLFGYVVQDWKSATSFRDDETQYRNSISSLSKAFTLVDAAEAAITVTSYEGESTLDIPAVCRYVDFNEEQENSIYLAGDFGGGFIYGDNRQIYFTCQSASSLDQSLLKYFEEFGDVNKYEISKIYRNNGEIKFGSGSAVGHFEIIKTDNIDLPISKISVRVKSWSDVKSGCLYTEICDENGDQLSNESFEIPASADWTDIEIYNDNLEHDARSIWLESVGYPTADDQRLHILSITVTYGIFGYEWKEISGGANVEIVEELPDEGEENTIYLIKDQGGGSSSGSINFEEVDELPEVGDTGTIYLMDPEGGGGGGGTSFNVEIVDELPEQGEDKKVYLIEESGAESAGTVTSVSISMNGEVKGTVTTSGTIDLGTVVTDDSGKENITNKVTTISATSTDTEYPSAKAVYDLIIATINGSY